MQRALIRTGSTLAAAVAALAVGPGASLLAGRSLSQPVTIAPLARQALAPPASPSPSPAESPAPTTTPGPEDTAHGPGAGPAGHSSGQGQGPGGNHASGTGQ